MFECPHLKFRVSGRSKQTNKPTSMYTHAQCNLASVGLTQAHPDNYFCNTLALIRMNQKLFSTVFEEIRMMLGQNQDGVPCY